MIVEQKWNLIWEWKVWGWYCKFIHILNIVFHLRCLQRRCEVSLFTCQFRGAHFLQFLSTHVWNVCTTHKISIFLFLGRCLGSNLFLESFVCRNIYFLEIYKKHWIIHWLWHIFSLFVIPKAQRNCLIESFSEWKEACFKCLSQTFNLQAK